MKTIDLSKSQCKRQFTGLIRKIQKNHLDKISIYENRVRIAIIVSPNLINQPLKNSRHELRENIRLRIPKF